MKNNTLKIALVFFLVIGMTTINAQDNAKQLNNTNSSSTKVVKKVKDEKEKTYQEVGNAKDKAEASKDGAMDDMRKLRMEYSEKIKNSKDPKEQARLKKEMEEKMLELKKNMKDSDVKSGSTNNSSGSATSVLKESKDGTKPMNPKEDVTVNKGKPTIAVKKEKVSSVGANLSAKRQNLDNSKKMVEKANAKVADAKAKLELAKEEGTLSKEEVAAKEAKISAAEAKIKKLEASIQNAEKKYNEKEETLSTFVKDQN
jgi:chromosome segregation ATPase